MIRYRDAKTAAEGLRFSAGDAVDSSRAWTVWEYLEKNPPPWVCDVCGGKGFIRHDVGNEMCARCKGKGDLLPDPVEPEVNQ